VRPGALAALPAGAFGLSVWWVATRIAPGTGFGSPSTRAAAVLGADEFVAVLSIIALLLTALWFVALPWAARRRAIEPGVLRRATLPLLRGAALPAAALFLDAFFFWPTAPPLAALGLGLGALATARRAWAGADPVRPAPGRSRLAPGRRPPNDFGRIVVTAATVSLPLLLLAGGWSAPSGDEPNYLMVAHSLIEDGDLDLADDFRQRAYAAFHPGVLSPHYRAGWREGSRYSMHGVGLPLLVAPAYAAGRALESVAPGAVVALPRLLLIGLYGLFAWLLYGFIDEVAGERAARYGTVATLLPAPLLFAPLFVFAEVPAMLLSLVAFRGLAGCGRAPGRLHVLTRPRGTDAAYGVALAGLPFVGIKYMPLALATFAAGVWLAPPGTRRQRMLGSGAPLAAGLLLHAAFTWHLYGSLSPASIYLGAGEQAGTPAMGGDWAAYLAEWPAALATAVGYFLDQKEGLLAYGPHFILACAGIYGLARRQGRLLAALALVSLAYIGPYALSQQLGGQGPPVRPLMAVVWVLAPALGLGLVLPSRCRGYAALRAGLAALAAVLTLAYATQPELLPHDYPVPASRLLQQYSPHGSGWWRLFPLWVNVEQPNSTVTAVWTVATLLLAALLWRHGRNVERGAPGGPFGADPAAAAWGWPAATLVVGGACALVLAHHGLVVRTDRHRPTAVEGGLTVWLAEQLPPRAYAEPGGVWTTPGSPVDLLVTGPRALASLDVSLRTLVPTEVGAVLQGAATTGRAAPGADHVARLEPAAGRPDGPPGVTYHAVPANLMGGEDERYLGVFLRFTGVRPRD
jgi:hypothetical protein